MIHQPHFLPWPGYVARCLAADTVVFLDNVKFNKKHFQHRTKYITRAGPEAWLTLPIAHSTRAMTISEVEIAEAFSLKQWQRGFRDAYQGHPEFSVIWPDMTDIILQNLPSLAAVARATLTHLLSSVATVDHASLPRLLSGSLIASASERTERLIEICDEQGITHLIMGRDALRCHDCELLRASGVVLVRHVYCGPPAKAPRPGVTVLHEAFVLGRAAVGERLRNDWFLEPVVP